GGTGRCGEGAVGGRKAAGPRASPTFEIRSGRALPPAPRAPAPREGRAALRPLASSPRQLQGLGQESGQRTHLPTARGEVGEESGARDLPIRETDRGDEVLAFQVLDEGMVRVEAARRAAESIALESEAGARLLPLGGASDDGFPDPREGRRVGMPEAGCGETAAGLQVQVEAGSVDVLAPLD